MPRVRWPGRRALVVGAVAVSLAVAACGAGATPAPSDNAAPGSAPALEAMLPSDAGGLHFTKTSFDGAKVGEAGLPLDATTLDPVLKANGKTAADVSYAVATAPAPSGDLATTVMAMRIAGVDAAITAGMANGADAGMAAQTLGGKSVKVGGQEGFWAVLYLKGDVMFEAMGASITVLDAVVAALP